MPVFDFELESDLEMEVVLEIAPQKDSPIYAVWMPVLYLGTENTSGLTVLCSAARGVAGEDMSCAFFHKSGIIDS